MSKFKVGDKVRALVGDTDIFKGSVYEVIAVFDDEIEVTDNKGDANGLLSTGEWELFVEPPKGTFERLLIEGLPQGGYKVTAAGPTFQYTHSELAAFTTLKEAVAFVERNMK